MPIEGEAGVGYRLGAGFKLPRLMFSVDAAIQQTLQTLREAVHLRRKVAIA